MRKGRTMHVPMTPAELREFLTIVLYDAPGFSDPQFPHINIDTAFDAINHGLDNISDKISKVDQILLREMASKMNSCFRSRGPIAAEMIKHGRKLTDDMIDILEKY